MALCVLKYIGQCDEKAISDAIQGRQAVWGCRSGGSGLGFRRAEIIATAVIQIRSCCALSLREIFGLCPLPGTDAP